MARAINELKRHIGTANMSGEQLTFSSEYDAIEGFIERGWNDGLPIIPPTADRVNVFLEKTGK